MKCRKCGRKIEDYLTRCPYCKNKVEDDQILFSAAYPHPLMRHIRSLIQEGKWYDWREEEKNISLFSLEYPGESDELRLLKEAYSNGVITDFNNVKTKTTWRMRVCIAKSMKVLSRSLTEKEAVMVVESLMNLFDWQEEIRIERNWDVAEGEEADFHQYKGMMKNTVELDRHAKQLGQFFGEEKDKTASGSAENVPGTIISKGDAAQEDKSISGKKRTNRLNRQAQKREKESDAVQSLSDVINTDEVVMVDVAHIDSVELQPSRPVKFNNRMNISIKRDLKQAKRGNPESQHRMGQFYSEEKTEHQDYREAVYWYQLSAKQGNHRSQLELGRIFDSGKIQGQNTKSLAIGWYQKLAEDGYPAAQCILGKKYFWGDGVEENRREAAKWFTKAAAQGSEEAAEYLKKMRTLT